MMDCSIHVFGELISWSLLQPESVACCRLHTQVVYDALLSSKASVSWKKFLLKTLASINLIRASLQYCYDAIIFLLTAHNSLNQLFILFKFDLHIILSSQRKFQKLVPVNYFPTIHFISYVVHHQKVTEISYFVYACYQF